MCGMEILSTISLPLFTQRTSTKTLLSRHHQVLKQRCCMEIHSSRTTLPRQDRSTASFGREEFGRRQMLLFPVLGVGTEVLAETLKDNTAMAAEFADRLSLLLAL